MKTSVQIFRFCFSKKIPFDSGAQWSNSAFPRRSVGEDKQAYSALGSPISKSALLGAPASPFRSANGRPPPPAFPLHEQHVKTRGVRRTVQG